MDHSSRRFQDPHFLGDCLSGSSCNAVVLDVGDAAGEARFGYGCEANKCTTDVLITESDSLLQDGYDQVFADLSRSHRNPQRLDGLVPGARVIQSIAEAASWEDEYHVF
jgi:hypothetical protein